MRNKSDGDLDDGRLVEGAAGERNVYKRREEVSPDPFITTPPSAENKKRMLFVMDVSGSMYYFNGYDHRLDRLLEAATLIMESFSGYSDKIDYAFMGHSGDSHEIPLINFGAPPKSRAERFKILRGMHAHTQYCYRGDNTLEVCGIFFIISFVSFFSCKIYSLLPNRPPKLPSKKSPEKKLKTTTLSSSQMPTSVVMASPPKPSPKLSPLILKWTPMSF